MIYYVYAVRDNAVQAFMPPLYSRAKGEAIRGFIDAVNDGKLPFKSHPEDYVLYFLGEFNDGNGIFTQNEDPSVAFRAIDVKPPSSSS